LAIFLFMIRTLFIVVSMSLMVCWSVPVMGQSDSAVQTVKDTTWNQWNIRLSPYAWLLGIKGQIAISPDPVQLPIIPPPVEQLPSGYSIYDIDLSFQEVRNSLKFALMLSGQYRGDRFVTQFNVSCFVLESNAIAPFDYIFQNNTLRVAYAGGDLGAGYRIIRNEKFEFDILLGLKFVYSKLGLTSDILGQEPISVGADRLWTDPVIATNFAYRPHKRIELMAYGDIGSTLLNENFTYQFTFNAHFNITRLLYISVGYRKYYVDFSAREAFFSGSLQGMIVKIGFQF
jgi:hypothetical protein